MAGAEARLTKDKNRACFRLRLPSQNLNAGTRTEINC